MLDHLRLESYGFCCKMRVTTAVTLLGLAGIIISFTDLIAGILAALDNYETVQHSHHSIFPPIFHSKFSFSILDEFIPYSLSHIIFIIPLIMNIILIKRNCARNFIGVRSVIRIICIFYFSFYLINIVFCFFLIFLFFVCAPIVGPRMNRKRIINVYIIINIVVDIVYILLLSLPFTSRNRPTESVVASEQIRIIVYSFYHIGYFVVLYNIMEVRVENANEMRPV